MRRTRKTKIVATLGPSSSEPHPMEALAEAGVDVFRINMSHTSHERLKQLHGHIRGLEAKLARPIAILCDLQGPKIRLGTLPGGEITLKEGDRLRLECKPASDDPTVLPVPHPEVFASLKQKHCLMIDDGKVRLRTFASKPESAEAFVELGGVIKDRKGINLPDTLMPISAMTDKDRKDLSAALALGVDWIALSFVQRPEDVAELRKLVGTDAAIMSKIEKPKALERLDEILELSDGLMVARGDLGVELPLETVPGIQKRITRLSRRAGKPVVVATQMLESMIVAPAPTRAEVSDVAQAVFEGADAVMLSAETASGAWPVEAVSMMSRIASEVEGDALYRSIIDAQPANPEENTPDAIMAAVAQVTHTVRAKAIVCWTKSGSTGWRASRERPEAPILVLTPQIATARRMCIAWGLFCVTTEDAHDLDDVVERAAQIAFEKGFAAKGERIVVTAGVPLGTPGTTNLLRVAFVNGR